MSSIPPADNQFPPDELAQLPHGRHGLPPEFVDRNQRERLIASFTHLVGEVGYSGATITAIIEGASVSSRTFYKFFETVEDCCVAAFEKAVEDLRPLLRTACGSEEVWPLRVRAMIATVLEDFAELPEVGRLLTVEPFVAGPRVANPHKAALEEMVPFLREGRELSSRSGALPPTMERGLLGALNARVGRLLIAGEAASLPELLPDLTQFVLTPYLGAVAAREAALTQT